VPPRLIFVKICISFFINVDLYDLPPIKIL